MKLVTYLMVGLAVLTPVDRGVMHGRRFNDYLVLSGGPTASQKHEPRSEWRYPTDLSDPPFNLYQVARDEEEGVVDQSDSGDCPGVMPRGAPSVAEKTRPSGSDDVLYGVELSLDMEHSSGFVCVRDRVPYDMLSGMFTALSVVGWYPVEDDEGIEPHEFADGTFGVKVWLYRLARPVGAILQDVKDEAIMRKAA